MFIKDNSLVDLKIYWRTAKNRYEAFTESEFGKLKLSEESKKRFNILNVKMIELTWELYNKFQDQAWDEDSDGTRRWNFRKHKEAKLKNLLKEWDAKDDKGIVIPVTEKNIMHLSPNIAEAILRSYEDESVLFGEAEKN